MAKRKTTTEAEPKKQTVLFSGQDITPLVIEANEKKGYAIIAIPCIGPDGELIGLIDKKPSTPRPVTYKLVGQIEVK